MLRRVVMVLVAAGASVTTVTSAPNAYACLCASTPVSDLVRDAEAAYVATPPEDAQERIAAVLQERHGVTMPFVVTHVLDGDLRTQIPVRVWDIRGNSSCGTVPLSEPEFLLIEPAEGPIALSGCSWHAWDGVDDARALFGPGIPVAATEPAPTTDGVSTGAAAAMVGAALILGIGVGRMLRRPTPVEPRS